MKPVKIKLVEKKNLFIKWNDGKESIITLEKLRRDCPCASCLAEREKQSKSYIQILNENQVKVSNIIEVGSYAIGITWKDGHNTGIYSYSFLKNLSE